MGPASFSHWNYRIVESPDGGLSIHEVYYDDAGVVTDWTEKGVSPYGETMQELNIDFNMMQEAFYEPVLIFVQTDDGPELEEHTVYTSKRTEVQ